MIVYGDAAVAIDPSDELDAIETGLESLGHLATGLAQHETLVGLLIQAGILTQAVVDALREEDGMDRPSPLGGALMAVMGDLAGAVAVSWDSGFTALAAPRLSFASLHKVLPRERLTAKEPEGYAYYALYPEATLAAARRLRASGPWRVIGIRSIGTSLSAMAAAGLGAPPPVTVRPAGHPFARTIKASPDLLPEMAEGKVAIVDEGPGLSGSSFGAVADWLEDGGISSDGIAFLPSHAGALGPYASERHRACWAVARRPVVDFDTLILNAPNPQHRLGAWVADLTGEPAIPLLDVSGGAWRAVRYGDEADWPASFRQQERRKFVASSKTGRFLLKFAGLGDAGARRMTLATDLGEAGFAPAPLGLRHGFLVEPWLDEVRPLNVTAIEPERLISWLGRYLGHRARRFGGMARRGADADALLAMSRVACEAVGVPPDVARWSGRTAWLDKAARPVAIDGRLAAHEWLERADGALIKTDAVDHHAAHDLVGCQDIAWDIAGAATEFALGGDERNALRRRVELAAGIAIEPELVRFHALCYPAFQLGRSVVAGEAEEDAAEIERHRRDTARYRAALVQAVTSDGAT